MRGDLPGADLRTKRAAGLRFAAMMAVVIVVLRYLPLTAGWSLFSVPENLAYDLAFERQAPAPPSEVAIVALDDATLKALGQFPFPRQIYAQLLDRLREAKVVAFDILFIEPDRAGRAGDVLFAAALRRHGHGVLGIYRQPQAHTQDARTWEGWSVPTPELLAQRLQRVQEMNLAGPIPELEKAAMAVGYVDIVPDSDGVYRRFQPARLGISSQVVLPHFGVAILQAAEGSSASARQPALDPRRVAVSEEGSVLINYCGPPGSVPRYSFSEVLAGKHRSELKDKIVLVGATAAGLYDLRAAPYRSSGREFFGVETNANIVNTLLQDRPLVDATGSLFWLALALLLGLAAGWLVWSGAEVTGPLLGLALVLLIAVPSFFVAFSTLHLVIPYGAFLWATLLPVAVGTVERMGAERRMIKQQFSTYVSPEVLEELVRHPQLVRQGQRRPVTVLFSDVRGSTTLSESRPPEVWIAQLNEYLSAMSAAILEQDGYLDKFMGDGILAVWNAFGTQSDHAERALRAADRMLEMLTVLNQHWEKQEDRTPLRIGISLHSGEAIVGNVGSDQRTQYTVIGDVVNTGSRLEGLTKEYRAALLLSEATVQLLPDRSRLQELGEVEVRGRTGRVRVFAVEGTAEAAVGSRWEVNTDVVVAQEETSD